MQYLILIFSRDLNYFEYKKNSNLDAHVGVFKAIIKVNDEPINEEITKILNFMLKKTMHQIGAITICKIIQTIDSQIYNKFFVDNTELCKMMNMCICN